MSFDASVFWPAFKAAGLLVAATVNGGDAVDIGYSAPDRPRLDGTMVSTEWEMEYQATDLPDLAEDDLVTITGFGNFRVREPSYTPEGVQGWGADGFFKRARLTKL